MHNSRLTRARQSHQQAWVHLGPGRGRNDDMPTVQGKLTGSLIALHAGHRLLSEERNEWNSSNSRTVLLYTACHDCPVLACLMPQGATTS